MSYYVSLDFLFIDYTHINGINKNNKITTNKMSKIKILHYSDLQVKIRLKNLKSEFKTQLTKIEKLIIENTIDIVVITGDLFDYDEPNDIERELVYQHIANVLHIKSVKELVIIDGNHDLGSDINSTSTPIKLLSEVGISLLNNVDSKIIHKLHYLNTTTPYTSKCNDSIVWLPYTLNDGYNKNSFELVPNKFNIALYHGIVYEYAELEKLPINNKFKLFKHSDIIGNLILAGDIHQNWNNHNFFYSGTIIQNNFGEGATLKFKPKRNSHTNGYNGYINIYDIDTDTNQYTIEQVLIGSSVQYLTIDLSLSLDIDVDTIKSEIDKIINDTDNYIFKLKLNVDYQQYRKELLNYLQSKSNFDVEIKNIETIDKHRVETMFDDNDIVEISESSSTKELIIKLFNDELIKLNDGSKTFQQVQSKVEELFINNLNCHIDDSRSYIINLNELEIIGGFQKLGPNVINCDFYGLSRISGTNGYGKTQIYNMVYWLRYGIIYPSLKKNQKTFNNLMIFNNKRPDLDTIAVIGKFDINNKLVIVKRELSRIWKTGTSSGQKKSVLAKEFVSKINSKLIITVGDGDDKKQYTDDTAEHLLNLWFGNVIDTLLIVNHDKLKNLINTPTVDLENLLINYIGNDFVKSMTEELPIIRKNIIDNAARPSMNESQLSNKLIELRTDLKINDKNVNDKKIIKLSIDDALVTLDEKLALINNKLINIGNIPNIITEKETKISELQKTIDNYDINNKPEKTLSEYLSEKKTLTDDYQQKYDKFKTELVVKRDEKIVDLQENIKTKDNEFNTKIFNHKNKLNDSYNKNKEIVNNLAEKINRHNEEIHKKYDGQINQKRSDISVFKSKIETFKSEIEKNLKSIKDGVCDKCGTVLTDEKHLQQLKNENVDKQNKINKITELIKQYNDDIDEANKLKKSKLISEINSESDEYQKYLEIRKIAKQSELDYKNFTDKSHQEQLKIVVDIDDINQYNDIITNIDKLKSIDIDEVVKQKLINEQTIINTINDSIDKCGLYEKYYTAATNKSKLDVELLELKTKSLVTYNNLINDKQTINVAIEKKKEEKNRLNDDITNLNNLITQISTNINRYEDELKQAINYKIKQETYKYYKLMIEKLLPKSIFNYYRNTVNHKFAELLSDVNFLLEWNSDGSLYKIDFNDDHKIYTNIQSVSGMETIFLGLAFVYSVTQLNFKHNFSHLFIDELTGQLNKGKNNNPDMNTNYQELLLLLLQKFKDKKIFIIDHVIKNMFETQTLELKYNKTNKQTYIEIN